MIAPDLFKVKPPNVIIQHSTTSDSSEAVRNINQHFYNHSAILVFPDTLHVPKDIKDALIDDSEYYLIRNFKIHLLVEPVFIKAFVERGEVTLLSVGTLLDTDDCAALTPDGHLVLSVQRSLFLKLGIEKGPAVNIQYLKKESRHLIRINLKHPCFKPEKNNYKRVLNQLCLSGLRVDVIILWEPGDSHICPSSIASYFHKKGLECEECSLSYTEKRFYNVELPSFLADTQQLFEWIGLFLLGATDITKGDTYEYLSSYQIPEECEPVGQVLVMQCKGILSSRRISNVFNYVRNYIPQRSSIPWIGIHIEGFDDSPVSWNLEPHKYSVFGDNNYSVILDKTGSMKCSKVFTSLKSRD